MLKINSSLTQAILEQATESIIIVNSKGTIEFSNKSATELFGYPMHELLGKSVDILLPEELKNIHENHRTGYFQSPGSPPMGQGLDLIASRKNGERFPVEISLSSIRTDTEVLAVAFIIDITKRKKAEELIKIERDRAQQYLDIAKVMFLGLDLEGKVTLINKKGCELLECKEDEIVNKNWFDTFLPQTIRNEVKSVFSELIANNIEPVEYFENPIITKNGVERIIAWHNTLLKDDQGKITGTLSSGEDITDKKRAEEETKNHQRKLIQADKMATLGILVSGVAHEINNPNNFILLNGNILTKVWKDTLPILNDYFDKNGDFIISGMPYSKAREKIGGLIDGIAEGSKRIQKIVRNLKEFSQENRGDLDEEVDLNKVVDSAIVIINNLINKSTAHFSVKYDDKLPSIKGNFQNLEQVVINLITNSCQALATKKKGITVSTNYYKDDSIIELEVRDEGTGISKENLERIMDPFFTTKREAGGTGLGLSISYNIVKDHGGEMKIKSEVGNGTSIKLIIPVNQITK